MTLKVFPCSLLCTSLEFCKSNKFRIFFVRVDCPASYVLKSNVVDSSFVKNHVVILWTPKTCKLNTTGLIQFTSFGNLAKNWASFLMVLVIYSERRKLRKSASFRTLLISLAYFLKVDIKLFCLLVLCYKIASQYFNILMSSTLSNNLQKEALTACLCSLVILFCYVHFLCIRTFHYLMCPFRHKNIKLQFNRTRGNFSPFLGKF